MNIKEQRSISFAQSERDRQFHQIQRSQKPPSLKSSSKDVIQSARTNDSQINLNQNMPPLNPRKKFKQLQIDHQKSYDSQIYEGDLQPTHAVSTQSNQFTNNSKDQDVKLAIVIQTSSCEQTIDDDQHDYLLASQRSVRTLKSLQSERFNRKESRMRADTISNNHDYQFQDHFSRLNKSNLNESQGFIQLRTQEAHQQVTQRMKLSQNPFQLQDPHIVTDNTKKETMQSMATMTGINHSIDMTIEDNQFHSRRMSKSSANLFHDKKMNLGVNLQKKRQTNQKASMVQGEQNSFDGGVSEQSFLEIPNEHLNLPTQLMSQQNTELSQEPTKCSPPKKGTQRQRPIQSQNSRKQMNSNHQSAHQIVKPIHINTVRDSSPMKAMGLFGGIRESQNNQKGSMSERQRLVQPDRGNKMFAQMNQFMVQFKGPSQNIETNYKQPKQGVKNQSSNISQAKKAFNKVNQSSQYHTQNSPQVCLRESIAKNGGGFSNSNYVTQQNSIKNDFAKQLQSDFVHSNEEEDFEIINYSQAIGANNLEQSSFNIGQSFHLPISQALHNTQKVQYLFSAAPPLRNDLNQRSGQQRLQYQLNTYQDDQPVSGNLNDIQQISQRTNKFQFNEVRTYDNSHLDQRQNSNFRNESLERILGDKASSLFDQIDKIKNRDYVRVNRSILQTSHDRLDSVNRGHSQTPILVQNQDNTFSEQIQEPRTNHIQRKRQLTFQGTTNQPINSNYRLQLIENQNQKDQSNLPIQNHNLVTLNEDCNLAQKHNNENIYPKSPRNNVTSVKDKIKNITDKMKVEISKKDDIVLTKNDVINQNVSLKQAGESIVKNKKLPFQSTSNHLKLSKIQTEETHKNPIKQVNIKDHFKKYLNSQKIDRKEKDDDSSKYINMKQGRNSHIDIANYSQNMIGQKKKLNETSELTKLNLKKQNSSKQAQVSQTISNLAATSPIKEKPTLSTMFQKRRQSGTGKQKTQNQVRKSKIFPNNPTSQSQLQNQQAPSISINFSKKQKKKAGEFECIIYLPNQPPEVLTESQLINTSHQVDDKIENQRIHLDINKQNSKYEDQIQHQSEPVSQNITQTQDKENIDSSKSRLLKRKPSSKLELKNENSIDEPFKQLQRNDQVDESLIQAKFKNLMKETRCKIQEIDNQKQQRGTPKNKPAKNMSQFLTINNISITDRERIEFQDESNKNSTLRKSYNTNSSIKNSLQKQIISSQKQSVVQSPTSELKNSLLQNGFQQQELKSSRILFDQEINEKGNQKEVQSRNKPKSQVKKSREKSNNKAKQTQQQITSECHAHCNCHFNNQATPQQTCYGNYQNFNSGLQQIPMTPEQYNTYYLQIQQQQQQQQQQLFQYQTNIPYPPMYGNPFINQAPIQNTPQYQQYPNMSSTQQIRHHSDQLFPFTSTPNMNNFQINQNVYPYQYQTGNHMPQQGFTHNQFSTNNFYSPYNGQNIPGFGMPHLNHHFQTDMSQNLARTQIISGQGINSTTSQQLVNHNFNHNEQHINVQSNTDHHLSLGQQLENALNEFDKLDDEEE